MESPGRLTPAAIRHESRCIKTIFWPVLSFVAHSFAGLLLQPGAFFFARKCYWARRIKMRAIIIKNPTRIIRIVFIIFILSLGLVAKKAINAPGR